MIALSKKMKIIISFSMISILIITSLGIIIPRVINPKMIIDFNPDPLISETASTYLIKNSILTNFGSYNPLHLNFTPSIEPTLIMNNLINVDIQGLSISREIKRRLKSYGFAIVDEGYKDIYEIYDGRTIPKFITTDLCLHAYHVLYDISLRILEGERFFYDFQTMLLALKDAQISLNSTVSESTVHEAINRNVAYLSVMLYLLNDSYLIPAAVESLTLSELNKINNTVLTGSSIFGYMEDFTQYIVRGHYTRNEILANYFKAMMYAGRMSFLARNLLGSSSDCIEQTRMAMLLISSFNESIYSSTVWDYWDKLYDPTVFYVGASDDLTAAEYYQIWQNQGAPEGDLLANVTTIEELINEISTYRKPRINSMFIFEGQDFENATLGFRLMGQRYIPDSYIFQQLVHEKLEDRFLPTGLDVFSVFGSPRADFFMKNENNTYPGYSNAIISLRAEFNNLTDYDWTQNLYWLWLYSFFPLLEPASLGYPGFMMSDAWTDKALMTAMGSWSELRHDTILYAKQSYTLVPTGGLQPKIKKGYIEPYPEVYSRLAALVRLMINGLESRNLIVESFSDKLGEIANIFDKLTELSIKELQNDELTNSDIYYINKVADKIEGAASYDDPEYEEWTTAADDRTAVIADVHTYPNLLNPVVLEVGVGNPFVIYVVVQDYKGNLRLTRGATFSYYEFEHPMNDRLSDEGWHSMLDTDPPDLPEWILNSLPVSFQIVSMAVYPRKEN